MPLFRRNKNDSPAAPVVQSPPVVVEPEPQYGVTFAPNGVVNLRISTVAEAKQAIKELKLKKKEHAIEKKEVATELARMRADHQVQLGRQGSMVHGGGTINKFARDMQRISRDSAKRAYVNSLAPLEKQKTLIERRMLAIDDAIAQVERFILENAD